MGNINTYSAEITIESIFGSYCLCESADNKINQIYYLTKPDILTKEKQEQSQMVIIKIIINEKLKKNTNLIRISNPNNNYFYESQYFGHSNHYSFFLKLNKHDDNKIFDINFLKYKSKEEFGINTENIYSQKVELPPIKILGSKICCICLEHIDDLSYSNNIYISVCKHIFHMDCIWEYIEQNDYIEPKSIQCQKDSCKHGDQVTSFPCPICRTQLEDQKVGYSYVKYKKYDSKDNIEDDIEDDNLKMGLLQEKQNYNNNFINYIKCISKKNPKLFCGFLICNELPEDSL